MVKGADYLDRECPALAPERLSVIASGVGPLCAENLRNRESECCLDVNSNELHHPAREG